VVLGALAVPALAAGGPTAGSSPAAPGEVGVPVDVVARDLKISVTDARTLLAREDAGSRLNLSLRKGLGGAYAGAWLDKGTLTVAVTDAAAAARVRAAGATASVVKHSEARLDAAKSTLDGRAVPRGVPGWYVDPRANAVIVLANPGSEAAARTFARGVSGVVVRTSGEVPRTLIDVIGGNAYFIGSGTRCSVGFSVTGGFVSAGHCGTTGATTSQPSGSFAGSSFPGNDYSFVRVSAGNTPRGLVNNYAGGTVTVAGSTDAAVGATVCRSGSTTGWHCGTIQARNASVTYPQGTVTGLIRTNVCAEPGDSGGSLLAGSQAQGVTSGGSGNCSSGGTTFFQPVNEILGAFGLTLVTGGGTPPPSSPPPGGGDCTGFQNTYTNTLASGGQRAEPNGSYYQSFTSGTHRACLAGPSGTDFDLYLQKWNGSSWVTVASGTTPSNVDNVSYSGTAGYYRYIVHAYAGSGTYTLGVNRPA